MGNSLRCCLACILPCGALDVIRIVHLNGHVEEYSRPVFAGEILASNPNHVLSKPCSQGVVHRILIVSPHSELKRGSIYFLIPSSIVPEKKNKLPQKKKIKIEENSPTDHKPSRVDRCFAAGKKANCHRRRSSGRVSVWQPHLESICED